MPSPDPRAAIPSVSAILESPQARSLLAGHPREVVVAAVRSLLDAARREPSKSGETDPERRLRTTEAVAAALPAEIARAGSHSLRRVVNATGVVVHTNLGRSPLAEEALGAIAEAARGYSNLEYDLATGDRSSRSVHVEARLLALTGAGCAHVVNNNAAALMLCLAGLARGREVIVSRGELVEIGGSFRIPDVMAESGARMVEVGTTNRTRLSDYEQAITPDTALLLKVHRSNFTIEGFTGEVSAAELSALGRARGIPVLEDLGSGALYPFATAGLPGTPTVRESLAAGVDIVTASGDKLLGGPQAGIIAGRPDLVSPIKKHPLSRAFRVDKLCLAALSATLALYADDRHAAARIPAIRMLTEDLPVVRSRAQRFVRSFGTLLRNASQASAGLRLRVVTGTSTPGGGAMPGVGIPTACVSVGCTRMTPAALDARLRAGEPPVVSRICEGETLLDFRTVSDDEVPLLSAALLRAVSEGD